MWDSDNILSIILYICVMLLYIACLKIHAGVNEKFSRNIWLFISVLGLTAFAVCRKVDSTGLGGTDAITYVYDFQHMTGDLSKYIDWDKIRMLKQREPLYYFLSWFIRSCTDDYKVYFAVVYFIISYGITYTASKLYNKNDRVSLIPVLILFVCYLHSFNVMRNWLAISICMIGLCKLKDGQPCKYIIANVIGMGFHYSTVSILSVYLIYLLFEHIIMRNVNRINMVERKRNKIYSLILISMIPIGNIMAMIYSKVLMGLFADTKYRVYMDLKLSWFGYIPVILIAVLAVCMYHDLIRSDLRNKLAVMGVTVNAALVYVYANMGGYRINDCFVFFRIWVLVELEKVFKYKLNNKLLIWILRFFIVVYFIQQFNSIVSQSGIIPYVLGR